MKANGSTPKQRREARCGHVRVRLYMVTAKDGRTYHQVADYSSGKRKLRTFSDLKEAQREADRIARHLSAGGVAALQWGAEERASYGRALDLLAPFSTSLEVAAATFADALKVVGSPARVLEACRFFAKRNPAGLPAKNVADAVSEFVEFKKARRASLRHVDDLRYRLRRFSEAFQCNLSAITGPDVQLWLDGQKLSSQSILNFRRALSNLFNFAASRGWIHRNDNPIREIERVVVRNRQPIAIYTPDEAALMLATASVQIRACLAISLFAGLRSKEVQRLDWRDVDLGAGHIVVSREKAKTASRRIVPLTANLRDWLALDAKPEGSLWSGHEWRFHLAQRTAAEAAGLSWKPNGPRHSFISYRLATVKNAAQVAMEAGNSQTMIHRHYAELVTTDEGTRWFAISPACPANVVRLAVAS